jgi:hypothetical protein
MSAQMYEVTITATAEVRDADGNLISSSPVEAHMEMTEDDLRAHRLTDEHIAQIKEQNR